MINVGELALVEVHGLPDNDVKAFTYRASYPVQVGHLVTVPAPEWSVRVTGRLELPGFVLGISSDRDFPGLRDIIPEPASPVSAKQEHTRKLVEEWRDLARKLLSESGALDRNASRLEKALDGDLGF